MLLVVIRRRIAVAGRGPVAPDERVTNHFRLIDAGIIDIAVAKAVEGVGWAGKAEDQSGDECSLRRCGWKKNKKEFAKLGADPVHIEYGYRAGQANCCNFGGNEA